MNTPIRAIIIDDENNARASIRFIIENSFENIRIVDEAESVKNAIDKIQSHQPDLLFLDITLSDGTGFDILSAFPTPSFKVIFITGHDELAIKAFRYNALNYILKPINPDEIIEAVSRSLQRLQPQNTAQQLASFLSQIQQNDISPKQLFLETENGTYIVKIGEIIRCEKDIEKTSFFLTNRRKITVNKPLSFYKDLLLDLDFCFIHSHHLINLRHVVKYTHKDGASVVMSDQSLVPILLSRKQTFLKKTASL